MAEANPELVAFNQMNRAFWDDQKRLMDHRMADRAILETAIEAIASEAKRDVSIRSRMSFAKALEDAERGKLRFIRQQARSGGKASKTDSLQRTIIDIVRQNSEMTCEALLTELRHRQGNGIIDDIDETHIYFRHTDATEPSRRRTSTEKLVKSNSAPISGLKHRLSRARNKIRMESGSR
jgi:hypothetical protein